MHLKLHAVHQDVRSRWDQEVYSRFGKRLLDLALTVPALILLSPVIAAVALLVRLKLGSPVLFRQQRPGLGGSPFMMLAFRTMTDARGADGELLPDEQRITQFGGTLRRTSLDELPELIDVLTGDMSLVGPRPLLISYLDRYIREQMRRHDVPPGLRLRAGKLRQRSSWEKKFAPDVWYVDHHPLWLDVKILAMTFRAVLGGEGVSAPGYLTAPEFLGHAAHDSDTATAERSVETKSRGSRTDVLHQHVNDTYESESQYWQLKHRP
jgi:lipopolysaccharide/colanic/teichoic acid biosynthesis glycosyltransferase